MSSPLAPESPRVLRRTAGDQRGSSGQQSPTHFAMDNSSGPSLSLGSAAYRANLVSHFAEDLDRRRRAEKALEEGRSAEVVMSDMLKIDTVEMYPRDNAREHRTERYELVRDNNSSTVLRRGQPFFMALRMKDRTFDPRRDVLRVSFHFGPNPQVTKGTKVVLPFRLTHREFTRAPNKWDIRVHQQEGLVVTVQVHIPANALVGLWRCVIETTATSSGSRIEEFRCKDDIYVIFNPFCRDDPVYLDSEDLRREYVMNETGKVFVGTFHRPKGRKWIYGQFSDVVLPAAQLLMEISGLSPSERGNPVQVVRAISAIVNSNDDDGLLEGKWEGAFEDGVSPWAWTGSCKIFEQFIKNGCKPVKYGQCWVFAAIATTMCRALGIPARPVTNFVSAHDTNHTLSVDKYFDSFGNEIRGGPDGDCSDSIWNFHVWTEVWMARPDLPHGYGGWQAIDATPQEMSGDKMQCGPSSVEAVRRGEIGFAYDTPFVYAEVNADVCHFQQDDNSHWGFRKVKVNSYHVGRKILTKRAGANDDVGDTDAEDVTSLYKNPEGSASDKCAVMNAVRGMEKAQMIYDFPAKTPEDVFFDLVEIDKIAFGQPFSVTVHFQNRSSEMRTISAVLSASSIYYTGITARRLTRSERQLVLQPGQKETLNIRVNWDDYRYKIVDYGMVKLFALSSVHETKQTWSEEDDFQLEKPKIDIQIRGTPQVGQDCYVTFGFLNPLSTALSDCEFTFEGPGLVRPQTVKYKDVKPGEMVNHTQKFIPRQAGERNLVTTFNSRELIDVVGSKPLVVRD